MKRVTGGNNRKVTAHRIETVPARTKTTAPEEKLSLLAKLQKISIDGPEDFSANLDQYLSGERHFEADKAVR
ncbi:MAG TPA: hypothetical protein VGS22_13375 [Thermoanaerobaculia bacterium]|jgi:hypothetical protein|nr:hypothetical protein [Thermoanaerobaculia bacterium]